MDGRKAEDGADFLIERLPLFAYSPGKRLRGLFYGAVERSRTSDLLITNQLLYQLSYNSPIKAATRIIELCG